MCHVMVLPSVGLVVSDRVQMDAWIIVAWLHGTMPIHAKMASLLSSFVVALQSVRWL